MAKSKSSASKAAGGSGGGRKTPAKAGERGGGKAESDHPKGHGAAHAGGDGVERESGNGGSNGGGQPADDDNGRAEDAVTADEVATVTEPAPPTGTADAVIAEAERLSESLRADARKRARAAVAEFGEANEKLVAVLEENVELLKPLPVELRHLLAQGRRHRVAINSYLSD